MKYNGSFEKLNEYADLLEENMYPDLSEQLPAIEYEKVFHLYLLSTLDSRVAFRKELKRVLARGIERVNSFLDEIFTEK